MVGFSGFSGVSQPNSLRHLRWAPFSLIQPCRSLEGIVLKNLRNTLRKAFNEPKDQPKDMRKIINKSWWLYLGPKIKLSGENRFQWILFLKTLVKSGKKLQLITIDSSPFQPFTWTTITVTITPREIWRWLNMHSFDCARYSGWFSWYFPPKSLYLESITWISQKIHTNQTENQLPHLPGIVYLTIFGASHVVSVQPRLISVENPSCVGWRGIEGLSPRTMALIQASPAQNWRKPNKCPLLNYLLPSICWFD